jgi:PAS domain S-box-containing protein
MTGSASHSPSCVASSELTAELSAVAESTRDSIVGLTPEGTIASWNPAAEHLYGYAPEEILGKPAHILSPGGRDVAEAEFLRRVRNGKQVSRRHLDRRRKDGTVISVSVTGSPVTDVTGTVVRIVTVSYRDPVRRPGEIARTRPQFAQSQRLASLDQLTVGVAHDVNSFLVVILSYVAIIRQELKGTTESDWTAHLQTADSDLAQISRVTDQAIGLVLQFLAVVRRDVTRPKAVDLNTVVTTVGEMLRRTVGENINIVISLDDDLRPVLANSGQLEQVLLNLAINGRDAMPAGGTLTIETSNSAMDVNSIGGASESPTGRNVRLRVSDTGTGMAPEVIQHAFEPFFTTKKEGGGTGLGLAIVREILEQNEGQLRVCSEPGVGTTFAITLPVAEEPVAAPGGFYGQYHGRERAHRRVPARRP